MKDGKRFAYDINYVVDLAKAAAPRRQARLQSPKSGVSLEVASTEPGVQFYDGVWMNVPAPGLGGRHHGTCGGCCFEPQFFPDARQPPEFREPDPAAREKRIGRRRCSASPAAERVDGASSRRSASLSTPSCRHLVASGDPVLDTASWDVSRARTVERDFRLSPESTALWA